MKIVFMGTPDFAVASLRRLKEDGHEIVGVFTQPDKLGNRRGWGIASYTTPEKFMGGAFSDHVYDRSPEESYARLLGHLRELLPEAPEQELRRFLK